MNLDLERRIRLAQVKDGPEALQKKTGKVSVFGHSGPSVAGFATRKRPLSVQIRFAEHERVAKIGFRNGESEG